MLMSNDMTKGGPEVLFVCRANVGRSQVAMSLYNQRIEGGSESAGTDVDIPGQMLKDWIGSANVITAMRERKIDISHNKRRPITKELADKFGEIVVLHAGEQAAIPAYLHDVGRNVVFLDIPDMKGKSLSVTREIADQIDQEVESLIYQRVP
jgi:protein-tyrosine-phosphatase